MTSRIRIGTREGLWELDGDRVSSVEAFAGKSLTALAVDGARAWAIVDGRTLWEGVDSAWKRRAIIEGHAATCLAAEAGGLLIGTEEAHVLRLTGAIYVNVHVGGVVRSRDGGRTWTPTVDIESDVHQVLAHPSRAEVVLAAAADGFGVSRDGGASWRFITEGMHAHYLRAVAADDDTVLVSASTGPGGRRAALYRARLAGDAAFERCGDGLPTWFGDNVDTGCLAASAGLIACGTEDGRVFQSLDGGQRWDVAAKGLPPVTCVTLR